MSDQEIPSDQLTTELEIELTPRGGYFAKQPLCFTQNEFDPLVPDEIKAAFSEAVKHRMEEGNEFEDEVEELFKQQLPDGVDVHDIDVDPAHAEFAEHPSVGESRFDTTGRIAAVFLVGTRETQSKIDREQATMAAMALGIPFIWNPRLPAVLDDLRVGEPDFMTRFDGAPNGDGNWAYVPGDVKHHKALSGKARPKSWQLCTMDSMSVHDRFPSDQLGEGSPRKEDAYQLVHYTRMLEALGHGLPDGTTRVGQLIGKECVALVHDLERDAFLKDVTGSGTRSKVSAMEAYTHDWDERVALARVAVNNSASNQLLPLVKLHRRTECGECVFRPHCDTQRKLTDDVSRVIGVTATHAETHLRLGTQTVADLARLDVATAMLVDAKAAVPELIALARDCDPDLDAATLLDVSASRLPDWVAALDEVGLTTAADLADLCEVTATYTGAKVTRLAESIDRARVMVMGRPYRARGTQFADFPRASIELHTDIEDYGGFVYLIGVQAFGKARPSKGQERRRSEYHAFRTWETTPEAEAQVIADWWAYVEGMAAYGRINKWGVKGYCYTHHERSTLLRKAAEHEGRPGVPTVDELSAYFDSTNWVDLYQVTKSQVLFPTEDVKLKTIATQVCGFVWRDEDPSGGNSMAWYADAVDPELSEQEREAAQTRLLDYNDDDCKATYVIAEWFSLNGESRRPGAALPPVEQLDAVFRLQRRTLPRADQAQADARELVGAAA